MATLSGYASPPKTLSGIVDVNASTAEIGGISLSSGSISGITTITAGNLSSTNLTADTLSVTGNSNFGGNVSVSGNTLVNHLIGSILYASEDLQIKTGDGFYECWGVKNILQDLMTITQDISYNGVNDYTLIDNDLKVGEDLEVVGNVTQSGGSTATLKALTVPSITCSGTVSGNLTTSAQPNITSVGNLTGLTVVAPPSVRRGSIILV